MNGIRTVMRRGITTTSRQLQGEPIMTTDTKPTIETEVVVLRGEGGQEEWRVFVSVDGARDITTPCFNSKGAAQAYADGIRSGYRKPEVRR